MADAPRPLAEALTDLFWKATPYGETEDGDIGAYLLPKGVMHRLLHQAREAGVTSAAFRSMAEHAAPTEQEPEPCRPEGAGMSVRKKWRLKLIPAFTYVPQPSMAAAYRAVDGYRQDYAVGTGRVHHVNVEVNDGNGWSLYERVIFPPREGWAAS